MPAQLRFFFRDAGSVFYGDEAISNASQVFGPCYVHSILDQDMYKRQHGGRFNRLPWPPRPDLQVIPWEVQYCYFRLW
jgi:hypothetical protein